MEERMHRISSAMDSIVGSLAVEYGLSGQSRYPPGRGMPTRSPDFSPDPRGAAGACWRNGYAESGEALGAKSCEAGDGETTSFALRFARARRRRTNGIVSRARSIKPPTAPPATAPTGNGRVVLEVDAPGLVITDGVASFVTVDASIIDGDTGPGLAAAEVDAPGLDVNDANPGPLVGDTRFTTGVDAPGPSVDEPGETRFVGPGVGALALGINGGGGGLARSDWSDVYIA